LIAWCAGAAGIHNTEFGRLQVVGEAAISSLVRGTQGEYAIDMNVSGILFRPFYWVAGKLMSIWVRPVVQPEDLSFLRQANDAEICFVLETGGLSDLLALERVCARHDLPSPGSALFYAGRRERRRIVILRRMQGLLFRHPSTRPSRRLERLVALSKGAPRKKLLLVPVSIYWGRSPDKERSIWKLLFSENWDVGGRTRKLFTTLIHGRNTLLRFSDPLFLDTELVGDLDDARAFRKVSRILRVHFRQRRIATVGPDLSTHRALVNQVLLDSNVRKAIDAEAGDDRALLERTTHKARKYANEVAAHVSYPTIRILARILGWLWTRLYDGIELNHIHRLHDIAKTNEIVYVPCHRSHFDYLLLSYIVYMQGLSLPYVAAGINLNIPLIGPILKRGGAFFLRRSFRGNRLYAAVFSAYLRQLLQRGYSIEYFIEGGRSRTGRLLDPKAGMLAMTVQSYLQNPKRPIVFIPVYFGYEKLIEGDSFISELGGAAKNKETLFGLFRSLRELRSYYGKVYVNIGEPICLPTTFDNKQPDWRELPIDSAERPQWVNEVVDELGRSIMSNINSAAAVTPISLIAAILLSTPKQRMGEKELERQLDLSIGLLSRVRYSADVTLPDWTPGKIIEHGEKLGVITRIPHRMGSLIQMSEHDAVLMTYFRNNVLHLFAVSASIACCFVHGRDLPHGELQRLVQLIYPYMREELCLKWQEEEIPAVIDEAIEALLDLGLLSRSPDGKSYVRPLAGSGRAFQLRLLGQAMVPMLQRFYLATAIVALRGSGALSQARLETLCQLSAERLSMLYGLHSPDFFDKALFQKFARTLRRQGVLKRNDDGLLEFDNNLMGFGEDARLVLGDELVHSILSLAVAEENND